MFRKFVLILLLLYANDCLSQKINFTEKNVPPLRFFRTIEKQARHTLFCTRENLRKAVSLNLNYRNAPLKQVLDDYFTKQPGLRYEIIDNIIVVAVKALPAEKTTASGEITTATYQGRVLNDQGEALPRATVAIKSTLKSTRTDEDGFFELQGVKQDEPVEISYVAHESQIVKLQLQGTNVFRLSKSDVDISMETFVKTGYQTLPRNMSTGSVSQVSNELFNRSTSPDVISRIGNLMPGVRMDPPFKDGDSKISIRGLSTYFASKQPLIILDNFPYDGDINNLNPNDVQKIDILKDAAAAAIWGARASHGVIVITTRKGKHNRPLNTRINVNTSVKEKPDVYYSPYFMSASDLLYVESVLTYKGFFDPLLQDHITRPAVTPGVSIYAKRRAGLISAADSARAIDALANNDVRNDFDQYFYRTAVVQQYNVQFTGGNARAAFGVSTSFDKEQTNLQFNDKTRIVINTNTTFNPLPSMQLQMNGMFTKRRLKLGNGGRESITSQPRQLYSYACFADEQGNPLSIVHKYAQSVHDSISTPLSLQFKPLDEISKADNITNIEDKRLELSGRFSITKDWRIDIIAMYENQSSTNRDILSMDRFYTRNLIMSFHNPLGMNESEINPIPFGGIVTNTFNDLESKRVRMQFNYDKTFKQDHYVTGIIGAETGRITTTGNSLRQYGYDARTGTTRSDLNYRTVFTSYYGLMPPSMIPSPAKTIGTVDISKSVYSSLVYNYADKYTATFSARRDLSNLLGVNFNRRAVVLWSAGLAFDLTRFIYIPALPYMRIRSSFGLTGNINKAVSGQVTLNSSTATNDQVLYWSTVQNAPNADLGWEQTGIFNLGVDFRLFSFISGVIEYYVKRGTDLIGVLPVPPSTGLPGLSLPYMTNSAGLKTRGVDVQIQAHLLKNRFRWTAGIAFGYNKDKVTSYDTSLSDASSIMQASDRNTSFIAPFVGKPLFSIYSYRWAGLDGRTGNPMGFVDNKESTEYEDIINTSYSNLKYHGAARPVFFGSITNTVSYKQLSLFVNVSYRLGYYFRASTISYHALYKSGVMHRDFVKRWQKPGDEAHTSVPSMPEPDAPSSRDEFYAYSERNVHRADNIRLEDVKLSYEFKKNKWGINGISVYIQGTNFGMIWKANKVDRDPDSPETVPVSKILSVGFKADF